MTLAYGRDTSDAGAAAKDITITTTLGITERLYQRLENYGNAGDGLITEEINRLSAQNLDTTDKIATLEARLVIYQNTLIEKYAAMERAITQAQGVADQHRSEEHTSEIQALMRNSYAVFCLEKKNDNNRKQ